MRLSYKVDESKKNSSFDFLLGHIHNYEALQYLQLGSNYISGSAQLSNTEVLAILSEVVTYSNAKIKIEFEDIILEFE